MVAKDYILGLGVPLLCAGLSLGIAHYYRSEDKNGVNAEKEAQYRKETAQKIQSIKEQHEKELQAHKNKFQEHLLSNQKELYEIRQELSLISAHVIRAQQQYEYVQSQSKLDNEALKKEIIKEMKNK